MTLSDTAIRNAKPGSKAPKLYDERGLFLIVTPALLWGKVFALDCYLKI